jgi:RNA polymerase sigma-70 factor (ECF subfamily)
MATATALVSRVARQLGALPATLNAERFAMLYEHTHRAVFRYVYGLSGGPLQDAEDLTAETYLRAWRARARFEGDDGAALGWLLQIARRLVIDRYRRRRVRPDEVEAPPHDQLVSPDASPEEQAAAREEWRRLWALLQQLPDDQREMLVLRYLLGWRVNAIARHFGMAENTVSAALHRLLTRLRRDWPQPEEVRDV